MNSTVDISKILILSNLSLLSPNSKIFVIVKSLCLEMFPLTWFACDKKFSFHNDDWGSEWKWFFFFNILTVRDDVRNLRINWRLSTILKTSNKGVWSNVNSVWRYAKVCIYWLRWNTNVKKTSFGQNKRYKKVPSFFLLRVLLFFCESYFSYISCFPRRLQDVFAIRLPKTSWRRLQDVFKTSSVRLYQDECLLWQNAWTLWL